MQQLMHSFSGYSVPDDILAAVRRGEISSFCLFGPLNVTSPRQLRELTETLYQAARKGGQLPPLIGIDQEGGQLIAVTGGATELPGNMALGATRSPQLAEQAGYVLGRELLAMGVNLDFAPSLDVNVNPANPVIGVRSFGEDPTLVTELGIALIRGLQNTGVMATAKHFPGHGDTANDTHHNLPVLDHSLERMNAVELAPFRVAVRANVGAVLTAHVIFSALDAVNPATLSSAVLEGILRREMGFEGLIITDAMDMHAVAQFGAEVSTRRALNAGCDLVMLGHLPDQLALNAQLRGFAAPEALARIQAVREKIPQDRPQLDVIGCAEHQAIAQSIAEHSITVVRGRDRLPLRTSSEESIVVITAQPVDLTPAETSSQVKIALPETVQKRHQNVRHFELAHQASGHEVGAILNATQDAKTIIVGTSSVEYDSSQVDLVRALCARGQAPIVIALRTPYDLMAFPEVETYLCAYGIRPASMEALARVLFGEIEPQGVLPCAIPGIVAD